MRAIVPNNGRALPPTEEYADITVQQKARLGKLKRHLATLKPSKFDMSSYINHYQYENLVSDEAKEYYNECGTTACAVGYLPLLFPKLSKSYSTFSEVCLNLLGLEDCGGTGWDFMFHSRWDAIDNTPSGCAKRIQHFIDVRGNLPPIDEYFNMDWLEDHDLLGDGV